MKLSSVLLLAVGIPTPRINALLTETSIRKVQTVTSAYIRNSELVPHSSSSMQLNFSSSLDNHSSIFTGATFLDSVSQACSQSLGKQLTLKPATGGGASGGGGANVSAAIDAETNTKYFIKSASVSGNASKMLRAEYLGVLHMHQTKTIKVPTPIVFGEHHGPGRNMAFVVFEYLNFCGGGDQFQLGVQLAKMHRIATTSSQGKFGFVVDNTIGATPQPNLPWKDNWADFWDEMRLGHMLNLTGNAGLDDSAISKLRLKTRQLLSHNPEPSLIHGDLWGGNKGFSKMENGDVVPVIFDPATYFGDREADIAMTYLFGGFSSDFYEGYESEWPLPEGHQKRKTVYNLYHILNHDVLFGGGYLRQAQGMIDQILRMN